MDKCAPYYSFVGTPFEITYSSGTGKLVSFFISSSVCGVFSKGNGKKNIVPLHALREL